MFKKELLIPALLGLGVFAQHSELNLANNTTMLLLLFVLLEDHQEIEHLRHQVERIERRSYFPYGRGRFGGQSCCDGFGFDGCYDGFVDGRRRGYNRCC